MSDLWIYYRRPCSIVRYRHGGAAAFDPAMRSPLARSIVHAGVAAVEDHKILHFPVIGPSARPQRSDKPKRNTKARKGVSKPPSSKSPKKRHD